MVSNFNLIKYHYTPAYKSLNTPYFAVINFLDSIFFLSQIYLYLYTVVSLKQYVLLAYNKAPQLYNIRKITFISNICCEKNNNLKSVTNILLLENKLLILKWLHYFLCTHILFKKSLKITTQNIKKLHQLYLKLYKKYKNIVRYLNLPLVFIIYHNKSNLQTQNFVSLSRTVITISPEIVCFKTKWFITYLNVGSYFSEYIPSIIITSLIHGSLF